jgi:formate hydrogenlyase regulatory protein HycA
MGFYSLDLEDNQFWGQVVASFSRMPKPHPTDWRPYKRWYAVLHKFDRQGKHVGTDHWFAGTDADGSFENHVIHRALQKLNKMVAALGKVEYADIEIELFQVKIDGGIFGMVDVSEPEEGPEFIDRVAMLPGDLLFHAPWNGIYDT